MENYGIRRYPPGSVTKMTALEGVFAAGDIYRGASLVVWAIKDGRDAADGIHQFLQARAKRADAA